MYRAHQINSSCSKSISGHFFYVHQIPKLCSHSTGNRIRLATGANKAFCLDSRKMEMCIKVNVRCNTAKNLKYPSQHHSFLDAVCQSSRKTPEQKKTKHQLTGTIYAPLD